MCTFRILLVAAMGIAALAIASPASALTVSDTNGDCGGLTSAFPGFTSPNSPQDSYDGGCSLTASSNNVVLTAGVNVANCTVIVDGGFYNNGVANPVDGYAHVESRPGWGYASVALGVNDISIAGGHAGNTMNCGAISPCLDDGDITGGFALAWPGHGDYNYSTQAFSATVDFCVDTPFGTYGGDTTGVVTNGNPVHLTFTNAAVGVSGATLTGTFNVQSTNGGLAFAMP